MVKEKITVEFVPHQSEKTRRPTAHTCGCVLKIPPYETYVDFKSEFSAILHSNVWIMDFV